MTSIDLAWTQAFICIPYADKGRDRAGCDCWGLIRLVYAERWGIELPDYGERYLSSTERGEIAAAVAGETATQLWRRIDLEESLAGDVLWFRRGRFDAHGGLFLRAGLMLHMAERDRSRIERYDAPGWASRLTGIYRWRGGQN